MKAKLLASAVVALVATALIAGRATAGEEKKHGEHSHEEAMKAWERFMTPGEHHAHFKQFEGKWTATVTTWHEPGTEPEVTKGKSEYKVILGGRYLSQDMVGESMGMPFHGMGLSGYDNMSGKHFGLWIDDRGTSYMRFEGECSNDHKIETAWGTHPDPLTGEEMKFKSITKVVSDDKHVFEMYMVLPDGAEFKNMEIVYERI